MTRKAYAMAGFSLNALLPAGPARRQVMLLSLGSLALGTDSFVISGILPSLGHGLGVSLSAAGLLITVFSAVYAAGAPVLAVLTGRASRRRLLIGALTVFAAANVLAAAAPDYRVMLAARVIAALAAGLYMPAATAVAAAISAPQERGRALAAVLGGLTVASVLGVPLGTLVGQAVNWRATFALVAVFSLIALSGIARTLREVPSPGVASLRQRIAVARIRSVPSGLLATALAMSGVFVLYTYLAWFLGRTGDVFGSMLTVIYLIAGITAVASNLAAGAMIDRMPAIRVAAISMTGLAVTSLGLALIARSARPGAGAAVAVTLVLAAWSLTGWLFNPAQQQRLLAAAGPRGPIALSLNSSAIYGGQALAGVIGGLALSRGPAFLAVTATACVVAALGFLGISFLRTPVPAESPVPAERGTGPPQPLAAGKAADTDERSPTAGH